MSVGTNIRAGTSVCFLPRAVSTVLAADRSRLPLVDALRALAASLILWHHFTLYAPLADAASPLAGDWIALIRDHARAAQVFFVVSGYVLARGMSHRTWSVQQVGRAILRRYCRLGLPYLAAMACAVTACAFGREWIDPSVVGAPPTWQQLLAHAFFLQDILGYDSLSAGFWFVCISFQLAFILIAGLYLRDAIAGGSVSPLRNRLARLPLYAAWALAIASLFYFNLDDRWDVWAIYYFGQFFLGAVVYEALQSRPSQRWLVLYVLLMIAAMAFAWRIRLLTTLATGLALFIGGKTGLTARWPKNRIIAFMGRTSYSLFLIHFPVLVVVATLWVQLEWMSPEGALAGLVIAYLLSVAAAAAFYRYIEAPAAQLSRRLA